MLFNSYIFLFLYLPLCLGGYYLLAHFGKAKPAKLCLTGFSLWFYGYFNTSYLLIMLFSILFNYSIFRLIISARKKNRMSGITGSRFWMITGVLSNLGVLFYFKYYDFFIENVNAVFDTSFMLKGILLPLGISFFTFQQIGFVVDAYRGEIEECSFLDYALFVSFFPQLIAGPIVNHSEMIPQFAQIGRRKMDWNQFTSGVYLFTLGMVKKVLVADTFGKAVNWGYSNVSGLTGVDSALLILFYVLQLYFDFSGYCNMARGLGWLFGIEIPVNFNSPYKAVDIVDFWKRWHITLSRFFTRYVYIPLGGNRKGRGRMYGNLFMIYLLSGIWHGAGWTYVLWSVTQGVLYILTRMWQIHQKEKKVGSAAVRERNLFARKAVTVGGTFFTFVYFSLTCVFFRSETVGQALEIFRRLFTGGIAVPAVSMTEGFNLDEFWYVMKLLHLDRLPYSQMYLCGVITLVTLVVVFAAPNADEAAARFKPGVWNAFVTAGLFLWCVLSLAGVSSFLYFNF